MYSRETDAAVAAASVTSEPTHETASTVVRAASGAPTPAYQAADTVTIEAEESSPVETIDDTLRRLIFHDDRPIENLPEMVSSELKLIGRCVSLCVKQTINGVSATYYYSGLVSMVTDTTVTLLYVARYTRTDFTFYQARERRIADLTRAATSHNAARRQAAGIPEEGRGAMRATETKGDSMDAPGVPAAGEDGQHQNDPDFVPLPRQDPAGSLLPALRLTLDPAAAAHGEGTPAASATAPMEEIRESPPAPQPITRPRYLRTCGDSIGILPFVTFLRTNIHDVKFGRDPSSEFYGLFANPSRWLLDMQFLRTFVRRYLVHTSEGNNPRQVPLYTFLMVRGACPSLDRALANHVVREELPALLKADRAIAKEKRKQRSREARLTAAVQEYRAPRGPFANTGVLYLTQIPQQTFLSAIVILVFTVAFALFLILSLTTTQDSLITLFVAGLLNCFIPSIMVWAMTGILTLLHSTSMHLPLRENLEMLIARVVFSIGSVICSIWTVTTITQSMSNERVLDHLYRRRYDSLCAFYERHQCSGYFFPCDETSSSSFLCATCTIDYGGRECFLDIWQRMQVTTLPLMMFSVFILLGSVNALMVLLKLYLVARSLSVTVFS